MPSASIGLSVVPGLLPTLLAPLLATLLLAPPIAAQDGTADIWSAARQGDLAGVRRILQATPDQLQARDDSQRTALHLAARWGRLEVLRLLLDRGAEVDAKAYNRFTPLHLAVTFRRPACVAELLARGADVEAVTAFDRTALQLAAQRADRQLVAALREAGARYDALTAVQLDDAERIDELLRGPDFETSHDVIEAAVARGDAVIVAKLLPRWRNRPRFLPNFTAVPLLFQATAHADVVRLLIGNGQDPAHRMTDTGMTWIDAGSTLLHAAAKRGHHATLRYLLGLEAFAAPDACRDAQQRTPAHTAAHNGHLQALVALHTAGSDLLARDRRGRTCVHHAAYAGNAEILAYLVQQGVALDGVDDGGGNALAHATRDLHPTAETTPARIAAAWVLVRHGVPADLHAAIAIGDHARAAALLE
ncbi:MAG: ankyrin repeat domain-containing protein, partial [Planctomycetes bacterium]|nr:ankyrin repeat domain-containing protein [Planctomycetota bacterium]